ncbi:MAG: magnesium/cobalt transporter CorA [bacterium]
MAKSYKRLSKTKGLPPGTLMHVGEQRDENVKITVIDYNENDFQLSPVKSAEECFPYRDRESVTWINVDGVHQTDIIAKLGSHFGLHPLVLEDIVNTDQRPKLEDHESYLFIALKMLSVNDKGQVEAEHVSLILGNNYVISFQEKEGDIFDPVRDRIKNSKGRIRKMGADYLAYSLLDAIVDNYFGILEKTGEKIELLEEILVADPEPKVLKGIHQLKREMIFLRKSVWPLREVISGLLRAEAKLIKESTIIYLRDVYDHTIQVIDTVESYRDMVSGMLDIYLSSLSNRMNEVMKVLTIIATIFIPLTFIAGIYGMNFKYMPELDIPWAYPLTLSFMGLVGLYMVLYFKRKKWL